MHQPFDALGAQNLAQNPKIHALLKVAGQYTLAGQSVRAADLGNELGLTPSTLHFQLKRMETAGLISIHGGNQAPKIVELTDVGKVAAGAIGVPILGCIKAGSPVSAQALAAEETQYIESWNDVLPRSNGHFVLVADGESMKGDGIMPGDDIIFRSVEFLAEIENGKIAAVYVSPGGYPEDDDCATVKRIFFNEDGTITLKGSNPDFKDIVCPIDHVRAAGVYVASIRRDLDECRKGLRH